jgi:hypothetical protein
MANASAEEIANPEQARPIMILIKIKMGRIKEARKLLRSKVDLMIADILQGRAEVEEVPGCNLEFFKPCHYHHYLGVHYFRLREYRRALDYFMIAAKEQGIEDLE